MSGEPLEILARKAFGVCRHGKAMPHLIEKGHVTCEKRGGAGFAESGNHAFNVGRWFAFNFNRVMNAHDEVEDERCKSMVNVGAESGAGGAGVLFRGWNGFQRERVKGWKFHDTLRAGLTVESLSLAAFLAAFLAGRIAK